MLQPDIYHGYLRDGVVERFAKHGARITLRTIDFADHFEYFSYDFQEAFGVVPTTLIPRFGIDAREEFRLFSLDNFPFQTDFYAVYTDEFAESKNGKLFIEAAKNIERQKPCSTQ